MQVSVPAGEPLPPHGLCNACDQRGRAWAAAMAYQQMGKVRERLQAIEDKVVAG